MKLKIKRLELIEKLQQAKEKELSKEEGETKREEYELSLRSEVYKKLPNIISEYPENLTVGVTSGRYGKFDGGKKDELFSPEFLAKQKVKVKFEIELDLDVSKFVPVALKPDFNLIERVEKAVEKLEMAQNEFVEVSERDDYFSLL